jgi:predicted kinase
VADPGTVAGLWPMPAPTRRTTVLGSATSTAGVAATLREDGPVYVVVTGPPASGKSTLSRRLADGLGLPLLAKDEVKQELMDEQPPTDVEGSRRLGRQAVRSLLERAAASSGAVLDSVWVDRERAVCELGRLGERAELVEVFCRCDVPTLRRRYAQRAPTKGPGHFDEERPEEELWPAEALEPLRGPWRLIEVDTTRDVDLEALVAVLVR